MLRNDYRRALIMLRGLKRGLSGYVRLERRTLMGSMQFTVHGADGGPVMETALLGRRNGRWLAVRLGALNRDSRGQAGMTWSFDPRNIQGAELEQYDLAAVVEVRPGGCELLMCGYMNGSMEVDWAQVRDAVCGLYSARRRAVTELPPADAGETGQQFVQEEETAQGAPQQLSEEQPDEGGYAGETAEQQGGGEQSVELETTEPPTTPKQPCDTSGPPAADSLALDIMQPWPAQIEPLRELFMKEPAFEPFSAEGYVFIRAPMPSETGINYCAIGIKVENGVPVAVCYAIPAQYTIEPPPGLEGYIWRGGTDSGYWVACQDAETGDFVAME